MVDPFAEFYKFTQEPVNVHCYLQRVSVLEYLELLCMLFVSKVYYVYLMQLRSTIAIFSILKFEL